MPEADLAAEMRELEQMDLRLSISFRRLSVKDVEGKVLVGTPVTTAAALCTAVCGDALGVVFRHAYNPLEPRIALDFSSASRELWALSTVTGLRQQLRDEHEAAAALCRKMGLRCTWLGRGGCKAWPPCIPACKAWWSCKDLLEARHLDLGGKDLKAADLATLGKLGSSLPVLESLTLYMLDDVLLNLDVWVDIDWNAAPPAFWLALGPAGYDGVQRLAEGLGAGALPALTDFCLDNVHVSDAGASAFAAALSRGALLRLMGLELCSAALSDAGLVALAPALRRLPALEHLELRHNPLGDEGLAALVAPPPLPAGALSPPTGGLTKLEWLSFNDTQVTDAGCAALAAALESGAMPALKVLNLRGIPASAAAVAAACELPLRR